MKRILLTTCALISLSLGLSFASVSSLYAATCNGVETSIDYHCDDYQTDSISSLLMFIINFMGIGVGIAVVAGIAWGGLTYARSGGDSGAAKEGMDIIRNAIIGLVLFLGLWSLANFFIPGGAFNLNAETATYNPTSESDGVASMGSGSGAGTGTGTGTGTGSTTITKLTGVKNFRDAGGSGVIKKGVLYRSGLLVKADTKELKALLPGGTIIDLRQSSELKDDGKDPTIVGIDHSNNPIVGTTNYTKFVNGSAGETASTAFGKAIKTIAHSDGPVLVHCTYGKDRTGWTIAMIMYALGATDKQVMTEYMKSAGQTDGKSVTKAMLNTGLSAIKSNKKYGTVKAYLTKGLGLTDSDIAALKKKLGA